MAVLEPPPGPSAALLWSDRPPEPQGWEGRLLLQAAREAHRHLREPALSLLRGEDFPRVGTAAWGEMNRRRAELIRKKIRGELSPEEQALYEALQRRSLEALERAFPRQGEDEGREDGPEPGHREARDG